MTETRIAYIELQNPQNKHKKDADKGRLRMRNDIYIIGLIILAIASLLNGMNSKNLVIGVCITILFVVYGGCMVASKEAQNARTKA